MDILENNIKDLENVRLELEGIKDKLNSNIISNDESTITKLNSRLTKVINELNKLDEKNAKELNNIKRNNKWIDS
jgi:hypothetical protein